MNDTQYHIQKEIPIPDRKRGGRPKYPWQSMDLGDSFFVPCRGKPPDTQRALIRRLLSSANVQRIHYGTRFTARSVTENDVVGVRVWRIE